MCLQVFICFIFTKLRAVCRATKQISVQKEYTTTQETAKISDQNLFRSDKELEPDLSGLKQLLPQNCITSRYKTNNNSSQSKCHTQVVKSNVFAANRDAALFYIFKQKVHFKHHK